MRFQYLGTAAAEGWPGVFCRCAVCEEARALGGRHIRTRSQAMINDDLLLDFPGDAILCHQSDICTTEKERRVHIMKNEIRFTLESKQRPKLAQEIGNILGTVPHYERVPSCAYDIAGYRLDKEGVLHIPEGAEETTKDLIRQLRERGFQDDAEVTEEVPVQEDKLTIGIPRESLTDTALENLQKIIANKQTLFQRAFWMDSTEIEITDEKINFTWFPYTVDGDEIAAYTQFISRLCDMARDAKRVSSKPTETDNDKYAFRCFLLRLGFIGKEYKTARKILLRNLTGNSASRYGE